MAATTVRGSGWRISKTTKYGKFRPWEAYWSGKFPPSGVGEDMIPFATAKQAGDWLKAKGAPASQVNKGLMLLTGERQ